MKIRDLLLAAAAVVALSSCALAQQPAPEQQRQDDDTPTFSTDDASAPVVGQPAGAQTEAPPDDSGMTPEERADAAAGKSTGGAAAAAPGKPGAKGPSKAELMWRERYAAAVKEEAAARQAAQEAELQETELRNGLSSTHTTADRNDLAARIQQQGDAIRQAQQAAKAAKAKLDAIRAEGSANKFSPSGGPAATNASGKPNAEYYVTQVSTAKADLDDAKRRVELYTNRVSDARGRALQNGGSGDNFAQAKIQEDIDAANRELAEAQADQAAAQAKLDAATDAARRANVALPRSY